MTIIDVQLLNATTAVGPGLSFRTISRRAFTFIIDASAVIAGGIVKIETKGVDGIFRAISTNTINANGITAFHIMGALAEVRANLTARTDGTYSVFMTAA